MHFLTRDIRFNTNLKMWLFEDVSVQNRQKVIAFLRPTKKKQTCSSILINKLNNKNWATATGNGIVFILSLSGFHDGIRFIP